MKCPCCNAELPDESSLCNSCGARLRQPQQQVPPPPQQYAPPPQQYAPPPQQYAPPPQQYVQAPPNQKSRTVYRLLAFFLGGLGIHNFYAGYTTRGIIQLVLTLTGVLAFVSGIWALIEIFVVDCDAQGVPMKPGGCGLMLLILLILPAAIIAILAVRLLPALQRAREASYQSNCKGNLNQIGKSLLQYANDNDGWYPTEMKMLAKNGYLNDPAVYVCPSTSDTPDAASFASSYIYLGRGVVDSAEFDGGIPIAMEKPDNHNKFINILYLDGHVKGYNLPRKMTSCVEIIKELHPDIATRRGGDIVLENAAEADRKR